MENRFCKNCKFYQEKKLHKTTWFGLGKPVIETIEQCNYFGVDGMLTHNARGYTYLQGEQRYFVKGPCGIEGKYWEKKRDK